MYYCNEIEQGLPYMSVREFIDWIIEANSAFAILNKANQINSEKYDYQRFAYIFNNQLHRFDNFEEKTLLAVKKYLDNRLNSDVELNELQKESIKVLLSYVNKLCDEKKLLNENLSVEIEDIDKKPKINLLEMTQSESSKFIDLDDEVFIHYITMGKQIFNEIKSISNSADSQLPENQERIKELEASMEEYDRKAIEHLRTNKVNNAQIATNGLLFEVNFRFNKSDNDEFSSEARHR